MFKIGLAILATVLFAVNVNPGISADDLAALTVLATLFFQIAHPVSTPAVRRLAFSDLRTLDMNLVTSFLGMNIVLWAFWGLATRDVTRTAVGVAAVLVAFFGAHVFAL
jgi:hypothetical protein